ncbi:hypothetical protein ACODT3_34170 [Streptomyces sp. 4.24]|uniref:hypothetical protein n=1 Tax=Streptomyces tritrimontium TaxID=3406573 RepID=UPI003BB70C67
MNTGEPAPDRIDELALDLLLWFRTCRTGPGSMVSLAEFVADEDPRNAAAQDAARLLRSRSHSTLEYTFGAALVGPTAAGLAEADRVARARGQVDEQFTFAVDELVRLAAAAPDAVVRLRPFAARTLFLGEPLREGIAWRAARYLGGHGLARPWMNDAEEPALMLTSRGEDCAMSLSTSTVRQQMNDQRPQVAPAFTMHVYGGAAAQGMSVTQNVGGPAEETALAVDRILALATAHGLGGAAFEADVEIVRDPALQPARRAHAWQRIRDCLLRAAPALAGQTALLAIERGLGLLNG